MDDFMKKTVDLRTELRRIAKDSPRWPDLDRSLRAFESKLERYTEELANRQDDPLARMAAGEQLSDSERAKLAMGPKS